MRREGGGGGEGRRESVLAALPPHAPFEYTHTRSTFTKGKRCFVHTSMLLLYVEAAILIPGPSCEQQGGWGCCSVVPSPPF